MAITLLTGKPGAGKGLLSMDVIIDELRNSQRAVVTNLAVELVPWVNGKGQAQLGLLSYLRHKYAGITFGAEWRVRRLTDELAAEFYLWRLVGTGEGAVLTRAVPVCQQRNNGDKGPILSFDTGLLAGGGHLYLIDEAWKFWSSRTWKDTGEGVLFYNSQHRKCGDDVFIVTQHAEQMETAIRRVVQEFWIVRNRSMMRIGLFRQPNDFRVGVYDSINGRSPMMTKGFKLDVKGIAQTYDTTAGVGLAGRMVGDVGKKRKGIPFWVLVAVAVLVPCIVFAGVHKALIAAGHAVIPSVEIGHAGASSNSWERGIVDKFRSIGAPRHLGLALGGYGLDNPSLAASRLVAVLPPARLMTGIVRLPGHFLVLLSDGQTVDTAEPGRISYLCTRFVVIEGETNFMAHPLSGDLAAGPGHLAASAHSAGGGVSGPSPEWRERSRPGSAWAPLAF